MFAGDDPVEGLDSADAANPARRALPAAFGCTEFQGKTRHLRHVDAIVENGDARMANQGIGIGKSLIVERKVKLARKF